MNARAIAASNAAPTLSAAGAALLFSLLLFGLLYSVIRIGQAHLEQREALPTIDFVRLKRDTEVETLQRRKPPPPPPAPPPPAKMKIASDAVTQAGLSGLDIPDLNLRADVSGSALAGKGPSAAAMFDGDIMPLQCPPTSYPADARRAGVTGWVQVEFVVNPDGSVRSARAIEAQPKGLFEASAVIAAQRCKFKPKMVDGKPVEQRGRRKWNFELNKAVG
jgi:protein TonB